MPDASSLLSVSLGLGSAASWGTGDFCGGLATRRAPVFTVVITSQLIGTSVMLACALLTGETAPRGQVFAWCMFGGVFGAVGLLALYRALAIGAMGIAAPLSGVLSAAVPVAVAAVIEGLPSARQGVGFAVALIAVWLISASGARGRASHVLLAIAAGIGFGLFIAILGRAGTPSVFFSIVAARAGSMLLLVAAALIARQPSKPSTTALPLVALAGLCDAGGNAMLVLASRTGRLDVAAVLSSLYAGMTVLLAWAILRERLGRAQLGGLALALVAIVLITAG